MDKDIQQRPREAGMKGKFLDSRWLLEFLLCLAGCCEAFPKYGFVPLFQHGLLVEWTCGVQGGSEVCFSAQTESRITWDTGHWN